MMERYFMMIRRELWEHRALVIAPVTIAGLILLAISIFLLSSSVIRGIGFERIVAGLSATGEKGSATGVGVLMLAPVAFLNVALFFTVFFYCLDALFAERKDRSILFWRSLPITDTETVLSKIAVAAVVAPLITFAVLLATQLGILILSSIFVLLGGGNIWELVWGPVPLLQTWTLSLYSLLGGGLWALPFVAWFLFCSAFVKKGPFLWAVLPFAVVPMLERLAFGTSYFLRVVWGHMAEFYAISFHLDEDALHGISKDGLPGGAYEFNPASVIDPAAFLASPKLWGGTLVAAGIAAATIYVRRYRPDVDS